MSRILFRPSGIALAVAASLLTPSAFASEINYEVNKTNLETILDDFDGYGPVTLIYPDASKDAGSERGFIVIDEEEDVIEPGIGAYQKTFKSDNVDFQGCIMSAKSKEGQLNEETGKYESCDLGPDSGKRFKLRATELNAPMDIVFDLKETGLTNLYNVYGKFSNYTGHDAKGFSVQVGTGIGDDFKELPGVELEGGEDELGKFPGGLFGGSAVEGLPFFSPKPELFEATDASLATLHTRTTDGLPTGEGGGDGFVKREFGSWLSVENVPAAWTYDEDGKPWTDNAIVAVELDGQWKTYAKSWTADKYTLKKGSTTLTIDRGDYPVVDLTDPAYLDPSGDNPKFADLRKLANAINDDNGTDFKPQDVAHALAKILEIAPADVDLDAKGWDAKDKRPKVTDSDPVNSGALVATWDSVNEIYEVEPGYQGEFGHTLSMEEMEALVEDDKRFDVLPGYSLDEVEDLANVNVSYAIRVNENVTGPFTMRVWVTDDTANVTPPKPDTSGGNGGGTTGSSGGGGGCTIGGSGTPDPALPAMVALGLGMLGWRRLRSRKQG